MNTISKVRRYLKCTWRPIHTYKILIFKHKYSIFNTWKWPWLKKNIVYVLFYAEKIIYKMFHKALDIYLFSDNFSDYFFIKIVHFFGLTGWIIFNSIPFWMLPYNRLFYHQGYFIYIKDLKYLGYITSLFVAIHLRLRSFGVFLIFSFVYSSIIFNCHFLW